MSDDECLLCRVSDADSYFGRRRVWEDEYWRLSVVLHGAVVGFAHLEPHRHIPFITDLDGPEAVTLGAVLARVTGVLRTATAADKVYVYVFGDRVPHLHFNLAPQPPGGPAGRGRRSDPAGGRGDGPDGAQGCGVGDRAGTLTSPKGNVGYRITPA